MCPLDYDLCRQTVTVYRLENGTIHRWVIRNALYEYGLTQELHQGVRRQVTRALLIIPGKADILPGDRVYEGEGPHITQQQWKHFLPVTVKGLAEINYVSPYFWMGQQCHTEAGRR